MDGGAWEAAVHGVAKSRARQSDFTFTFHFHALEKEMATHSIFSGLENPRDRGSWLAIVHMVTKSQIRLSTHTQTEKSTSFLVTWQTIGKGVRIFKIGQFLKESRAVIN